MTHIELFVVALANAIMPWLTLWVIAQFFLRAGKRMLDTIDDLTAQVVAFKNPWAAELFGKSKAERADAIAKHLEVENMRLNKDMDAEQYHDDEADLL